MEPEISVVVASFSGEPALARCLDSLLPQSAAAQVIAATTADAEAVARLQRRFAGFEFVRGPEGASVFRLRALGAHKARAPFVALTEDHCTVAPGWVAALLEAHRRGHGVVGGPVENGLVTRAYDWGLYFCEYGIHMPPLHDGGAVILSGLNVSYRRELLEDCRAVWEDAFYESDVHEALKRSGHGLRRAGKAWVKSHLELPLRGAMAHLFTGARRYGHNRASRTQPLQRALLPLSVVAVPALLAWRILRAVLSRRPERVFNLLMALPYVVSLILAWSAGEAAGYLGTCAVAPART